MAVAPGEEKEIEIVDIVKIPSTKPGRAGKFDYLIAVRLPNGRIHYTRIPEEELNLKDEETARKVIESYIREEVGEILKWIGKKLKVTI